MSPENISSQVSSKNLIQTYVTAHLDAEITHGRNLICCATFQIAWNQLIDEIINAEIEIEGNPFIAQSLNKRRFNKQDISRDSYLALAGFGRDGIIEQIKQGLEEKFKQTSQFDLALRSPDDIVAYSYLKKSLPFDKKFHVFDTPLVFSDGLEVQWEHSQKVGMYFS